MEMENGKNGYLGVTIPEWVSGARIGALFRVHPSPRGQGGRPLERAPPFECQDPVDSMDPKPRG